MSLGQFEPVAWMPSSHPAASRAGIRLERHRLYATAGLVWSGDLPRQLQLVLFDTADGISW
jgi:hypothetical protein